jgi:carbon storage regulator
MLVLSRRIGESLMIGNDTEIIILSIKGTTTRIGINAPKSVNILRKEIKHRRKMMRDSETEISKAG